MTIATKLLPVAIPGTDYAVEPGPDGRFVQEREKSFAQALYNDNSSNYKVLQSKPVRMLWHSLQTMKEPQGFYNAEMHKPYGAEAGDLAPLLKQLEEEMHGSYLRVNGALAVSNQVVLGLGDELPAFIQPIGIYTRDPFTPKDAKHGMTLDEFEKAEARIVAFGSFPASEYPELLRNEYILSADAEPVGALRGDRNYTNLDPDHSLGVKPLGWYLRRSDGRPSGLYSDDWLDYWGSFTGVLRGRKLNAASAYQEKMRTAADQMELLARNLRNGI